MKITTNNIKKVLSYTKIILDHQEEVEILKGEKFNVFSILKMESKENSTHSAFLGELLNPKGSHLKGSLFLQLFLDAIGFKEGGIDIDTALLTLEYHIGERNDIKKEGGRIDIYLKDNTGNTISIENKIYAGDQETQIERYVNHNKAKNTVYYLTLYGEEATEKSKGDLKSEKDYHIISYRETIVTWLESCLREAAEQPILRESIKQYILLIKKLTNQLTDSKMEKEITDLIAKNYHSSAAIASNLGKVELQAANSFLSEIKVVIENKLGKDWTIKIDNDLNQTWTGLIIYHKGWDGIQLKLEGASKVPWNDSIYGIRAHKDKWKREDFKTKLKEVEFLKQGFGESRYWPFHKKILAFGSTNERAKLYDNNERKILIEEVVKKLAELAIVCKLPLSKVKKIPKS